MNNMYDKIIKKQNRTICTIEKNVEDGKMKITQRQKIVVYMQENGSITSWEAYRELGITQFAARVKELKEEGYKFETKWEKEKNREGNKIKFKRYFLLN